MAIRFVLKLQYLTTTLFTPGSHYIEIDIVLKKHNDGIRITQPYIFIIFIILQTKKR